MAVADASGSILNGHQANHSPPHSKSYTTKTYAEALPIIDALPIPILTHESIPLHAILGRTSARIVLSPISTPPFPASAMDGYAIPSILTSTASQTSPLRFEVIGSIAAGDPPFEDFPGEKASCCVEIMTGAQMPTSEVFDAVVRVEDTTCISDGGKRYIEVRAPVAKHANVRSAGDDFSPQDVILRRGEIVQSEHILALASVGIAHVDVLRSLRVGIWSTGKEVLNSSQPRCKRESTISDANSPYLLAALAEMGIKAEFMGILDDEGVKFRDVLRKVRSGETQFDVMVTTGAVSMGKFDFVPGVLAEEGADVKFHGLAIRPGHPVLCATLENGCVFKGTKKDEGGKTIFFGLPGNPIAAAVCFRFLVSRYLNRVRGRDQEVAQEVDVRGPDGIPLSILKPVRKIDLFRHGRLHPASGSLPQVWLHAEQSPSKIRPLLDSDRFVHTSFAGEQVVHRCYPISGS